MLIVLLMVMTSFFMLITVMAYVDGDAGLHDSVERPRTTASLAQVVSIKHAFT